MKRATTLFVIATVLLAGFSLPAPVNAQSTTTVVYPNDNVTGAAVSGRRPGLRTSAGIGTVVNRQAKILYGHDGAAPQERPARPDFRTLLLVDVLDSLFTSLTTLFTAGTLLGGLTGG